MSNHHEAIARRMVTRLAPGPNADTPISATDETTDESATGDSALLGGDELVLSFAHVIGSVAAQAWAIYTSLEPNVRARRQKALETRDGAALQRETVHLKQLLVRRLQGEAKTPAELPETGRARILDAAAEETLVEAESAH